MHLANAFLWIAFVVLAAGTGLAADNATNLGSDPAVVRKLYDLGYPTDLATAIQRWRNDNLRTGDGPLIEEETAMLLAQPQPEMLSAMVGNPFLGMGLALRHKTREAAEEEAIRICRERGGGESCKTPVVARSEQCVAVVGYDVVIQRRPTYRTSVAISMDMQMSLNAAKEACQTGGTHPGQCRLLVRFCGDGRELELGQ